jgi:hypothetical protein
MTIKQLKADLAIERRYRPENAPRITDEDIQSAFDSLLGTDGFRVIMALLQQRVAEEMTGAMNAPRHSPERDSYVDAAAAIQTLQLMFIDQEEAAKLRAKAK